MLNRERVMPVNSNIETYFISNSELAVGADSSIFEAYQPSKGYKSPLYYIGLKITYLYHFSVSKLSTGKV